VPNSMFTKPLNEATPQEIQLELIRRSGWNDLNGERVVASLLVHRELWQAVLIDRLSLSRPGRPPASGLIKLRDLPDGFWNADTLYILTPDATCATMLATIAEDEDWGGMVQVHTDQQMIDAALGSGRSTQAVVSIWWD
jgi:hypothetical protein